jgi:hypothetical protein
VPLNVNKSCWQVYNLIDKFKCRFQKPGSLLARLKGDHGSGQGCRWLLATQAAHYFR